MKRAIHLLGLVLLFNACEDCSTVKIETPVDVKAPNILLVIADDMGLDACPGYSIGVSKPNMPVLDSLRNTGLIFDNVWATPECSPTRASILTGRYGFRTGVLAAQGLNQVPLTETSVFKYIDEHASVDYTHAVIGKWHLSGTSNGGASNPNMMGVGYYSGFLQGALQDYYNFTLTTNGQQQELTNTYATTKFTDLAIDWTKQQINPWFLWLAYTAPHTPFHLPPDSLHYHDGLPADQASIDANTLAYYQAMMESVDHEVGRFLRSLSAADRSNTIVIFIGDNGTPAKVIQAPYTPSTSKSSLNEGGVHIPMVISGKGLSRKGERESALVNTTDLFATIAELSGASLSSYQDSRSLKSLFTSSSTNVARDFIYSEIKETNNDGYTIRTKDYKLIKYISGGTDQFYDMKNDPYEKVNLLNGTLTNTQQTAKVQLEGYLQQLGR